MVTTTPLHQKVAPFLAVRYAAEPPAPGAGRGAWWGWVIRQLMQNFNKAGLYSTPKETPPEVMAYFQYIGKELSRFQSFNVEYVSSEEAPKEPVDDEEAMDLVDPPVKPPPPPDPPLG